LVIEEKVKRKNLSEEEAERDERERKLSSEFAKRSRVDLQEDVILERGNLSTLSTTALHLVVASSISIAVARH